MKTILQQVVRFKLLQVTIGLWIDLTNTSRFYNKSEVEDAGCTYVKLPCAGHEQPPTREQAQVFVDICSKFVEKNPLHSIGNILLIF